MTRIGVVVHHHRDEVFALAQRIVQWGALQSESTGDVVEVVLPKADAAILGLDVHGRSESSFADGLDLCVSVGGDGTILRAVQLAGVEGVPVVGVNVGQLGYLTEVDPSHLEPVLDDWHAGRIPLQERMLLEVVIQADGAASSWLALNEVSVSAQNTRSVSVDASISGRHFTTYLADGVIVATPTGSTAYSLSAGGPIVEPGFHALLLTPVAPHMVFDRSLVLAPSSRVTLTVSGYRPGQVAIDGRAVADLVPGQWLEAQAAERRATFLDVGDRDFHTILKEKFGLTDR